MRSSALPPRPLIALLASATLVVGVTGLSGCAASDPFDPFDPIDLPAQASARAEVADAARLIYGEGGGATIEDYARSATEKLARSAAVQLIGYDAYEGAGPDEPLGRLEFRAFVHRTSLSDDPYVGCFWAEFDIYGVLPGPDSDDAAIARGFDCPDDAAEIDPPVDTSPVYVVPEGTEAVVVEVLEAAPLDASAEAIVAEVIERMPEPTGAYDVPFEPAAVVVDGEIGFAMGAGRDCLLVKRTTAEGVAVVHAPSILLEPGELGCRPQTALLPEEDLRSPH
jgi:hypothetical protein